MYDIFDYLAPVHGLLLVYRRCVDGADFSSLVRCDPMGSDAVISHTGINLPSLHCKVA